MQNYVNLNIDYTNFNQSGRGVRIDGGLGGGDSEGLGEGEKGDKGEKIYKTIIIPFNIPTIDYVIENDFFIEIIDNLNKNELLGQGKISKYRLNGPPTDYDIFVEMDNENVYHVKKRGIMIRVKINDDQYKTIVKMLTNINIVKISGGGSGGGGSAHAPLVKKKKWFSWFKCFSSGDGD